MSNMKKEYVNPQIEVVQMKMVQMIAASGDIDTSTTTTFHDWDDDNIVEDDD
jgi:hypothetical protein